MPDKKIILVLFNGNKKTNWKYGKVYTIPYTTKALLENRNSILNEKSDYILFWDVRNKRPSYKSLLKITEEKGDIWHIGDAIGLKDKPSLLKIVQPTSMWHVQVKKTINHSSWKCTFKGCLLKKELFDSIPIDDYSKSLDIIGLDFGYNAVKAGAMPRFNQQLARQVTVSIVPKIKLRDELAFIKRNFDSSAFFWCCLLAFFRISPVYFFRSLRLKKKAVTPLTVRKKESEIDMDAYRVSIVIATLHRYPYLKDQLAEIRNLDPRVNEIIIVDQTPKNDRDTSFFDNFLDMPITYLTTDTIGQCSARNIGFRAAKGNYIWFLDDDMQEFPEDYLAQHIETLEIHKADISCGMPDEVGIDYIDRTMPKMFLSDGFPTNDVLLKKELLEECYGFDEKMDRLQSEDQEIGLRLTKKGALSVKNNQLRLLHLRAPKGGLRAHKVRRVTFSASRKNLFKRRLLHYSEIYLSKKHFPGKNIFYLLLLNIRGTFIIHGNIYKRLLKILIGFVMLIPTIFVLYKRKQLARQMFKK